MGLAGELGLELKTTQLSVVIVRNVPSDKIRHSGTEGWEARSSLGYILGGSILGRASGRPNALLIPGENMTYRVA